MERRVHASSRSACCSRPLPRARRPLSPPAPQTTARCTSTSQPLPLDAARTHVHDRRGHRGDSQGGDVPLELALTTVSAGRDRRQRLARRAGASPRAATPASPITIQKASVKRASRSDLPRSCPTAPPGSTYRSSWPADEAAGRLAHVDAGAPARATPASVPTFSAAWPPRPIASRAGFVSNSRSNTITVFDKRLRQAPARHPHGAGPSGMALDQRSGRLYVACQADDEVQVDRRRRSRDRRAHPRSSRATARARFALTPDGRTLVSVNAGSNSISVFDAAPPHRLERIAVGSGPGSLLIDSGGRRAFVFNTLSSSISVVDIARRSVVATIADGCRAAAGAVQRDGATGSSSSTSGRPTSRSSTRAADRRSRGRGSKIGIGAIKVDARRNLVYIGGPTTRWSSSTTPHAAADRLDADAGTASPTWRSTPRTTACTW